MLRITEGGRIPELSLGTWQLEGADCERAVEIALGLGYHAIDTAQGYGNEAEIGRALARSGVARDDVFLTTKVWPDDLIADPGIVGASLERLGVAQVDLLLLHWPSQRYPVEDTVKALAAVRERGETLDIGVSNFPPSLLGRSLELAPVVCNQVEYHPYLSQGRLLRMCRAGDIELVAYSPLARGRVRRDERLRAIGARYGVSAAQVALRWVVQQDGVAAVVKASSEEHLRANLAIFDFELSDEDMRAVTELERGERLIDPEFAPNWQA